MKKLILILTLFYAFSCGLSFGAPNRVVLRDKKAPADHNNLPMPADEPDVYLDTVEQEIIIDGPGVVSYYDVEIASATNWTVYISTQVSGVSPNSTIMLHYNDHIPYIAPLVLQNTTLDKSQYVIASDVIVGKHVDSNRTSGEVVVASGAEYEIEMTGEVKLMGGFKVEKGATFSVNPSYYNK